MKKIISITMILLLLLGQVVSASGTYNEKAYFDVVSLGIFEGDENGDLRLEDPLTRAEFAAIMTRVLRCDDLAEAFKEVAAIFSDVRSDDWFSGYISAVCANGLMRGVSDTSFEPNSYVTYEQAVKTIVCALGYGVVAERLGGYPDGYLTQGTKLGLTKNVKNTTPFTRENVMQLIYNALDVEMLVMTIGGKSEYEIEEGKTLRNMYLSPSADVQVIKNEGIVTANNDTYLNNANSKLERDEVEIDDVVYKVGNTNAYHFIGQKIEYYAMDDGAERTLISVKSARKNIVKSIDVADLITTSLTEVSYEENGKIQNENIEGAKIVRNGRLVLVPNISDMDVKQGDLKLIDNNDDNVYDVVFVTDWKTVKVKDVKEETVEFERGSLFNGSKFLHINLDDNDENVHFVLKNSEGESIKPSDIEKDSILSISADKDKKFYTIISNKVSVEGIVTTITEEYVELGDKKLPVYIGDTFDFGPGDAIVAYLDFKGHLVAFKEQEQSENYAYVLGINAKGGLKNEFQLKMVVGSNVEFIYDKNKQDLDDTNLIPAVNCKNSEINVFDVADKVTVDGNSLKTADEKQSVIVPGLYMYELNDEGEIRKLESATFSGGGSSMSYNPYDKTFAKNSFRTPFAINEKTVVICLPTNGDASDEDYFVPLKIKNSDANPTFFAEGYDYDAETKKVKALIFYDVMRKSDVLTINTDSSSIGMVEKSTTVLDENKEPVQNIKIATKSGTFEYNINEVLGRNDNLKDLKCGDLIYYEVDLSGKLSSAQVIRSFAESSEAFDETEELYGNITSVEYDELHLESGNLVAKVTADTSKGVISVDIPQRNVPPIFIYNKESKTVEIGSISEVYPRGSEDYFYALMPASASGTAKACVFVR